MILIVLSGMISLGLALLCTPLLIKVLSRRNLAQSIRESGDGIVYPEHSSKRGTPSMGGLAIVGAVVLGYGGAHLLRWTWPTASGLLVLFLMVGLAMVGFADDYLKVFKSRSGGIRARTKLLGPGGGGAELRLPGHAGSPTTKGVTPATAAISAVRDLAVGPARWACSCCGSGSWSPRSPTA